MKILCIITDMGSGGAERQLTGLASMLSGEGHSVRLCWFEGKCFYESELLESGVSYCCLNAGARVLRMLKLFREICRFRPDAVVAFLDGAVKSALHVRRVFPWLRFRLIVSERNVTQKFSPEQNRKYRSYRSADAVVCNSYSQTRNLSARFPELRGKLRTITNFTDLERFRPAVDVLSAGQVSGKTSDGAEIYSDTANSGSAAEATDKLAAGAGSGQGVPGSYGSAVETSLRSGATAEPAATEREEIKIAVVARIAPQKNVERFIAAASAVASRHPEIVFDWYGTVGGNEPAKPGPVRFHKAVSKVEYVYRNCDALCLPSLYEGFPNVICEAMASGLPVLCSNVCDNPNLVENGVNGLLFNPLSERSIQDTIEKFASLTPEVRSAMGAKSREKAEAMLSKKDFLSAWKSLLK